MMIRSESNQDKRVFALRLYSFIFAVKVVESVCNNLTRALSTSGTYRMFVGLSANNATLNAQPSTLNNTLGIGLDSTDTNFQFMIRDTSTSTKIDTTIAANTTTVYDFYMYTPPNNSTIYFELRNSVTNDVLKTSQESANLPANTVFMYMQSHIQSVTGTTAKLLALNRMYLESNL